MGFRPTPEIREWLEEAAKENQVSLSQEIENILERSFQEEKSRYEFCGGKLNFRMTQIIGMTISLIEEQTGKKWTKDSQTYADVKYAINGLLDQLGAKGRPDGLRTAKLTEIGRKTLDAVNETIRDTIKHRNSEKSES